MDETIRIYRANTPQSFIPHGDIFKKKTKLETLQEVFSEHDDSERELRQKYPCTSLVYNWVIALTVIALFVSFIVWGIQISNDRKVASMFATAMADFDAEQAAKETAAAEAQRQLEESEAYVEQKMAESLGLLYQGADKFTGKYGYSELDFKTYGRCVFNRIENPAYSDDLFEVVNQPEQWVGYNPNAALMDSYYQMALRHIHEWRHESTKPCSNDYLWAELTPNGIFLKNDFHADGYAIRWRAS